MKFSTYGIWEQDIQNFIAAITNEKNRKTIEQWGYSEAMCYFAKTSKELLDARVNAHLEAFNKILPISAQELEGLYKNIFTALRDQLQKKLEHIRDKEIETTLKLYDTHTQNALDRNRSFFPLDAELFTQYHVFENEDPENFQKNAAYLFTLWTEAQTKYPEFAAQLKSGLALYKEFITFSLERENSKAAREALKALSHFKDHSSKRKEQTVDLSQDNSKRLNAGARV